MESPYDKLKRTTLKDLLEIRGGNACNQPRRELIAELTELDQSLTMTEALMSVSKVKNRIVGERLSWFSLNPTMELIQQTMAQVDVEIRKARAHKLSLCTPQQNPSAGM
ncbi:Hypothetical predicted protein, partial [Pelobates cultripes]